MWREFRRIENGVMVLSKFCKSYMQRLSSQVSSAKTVDLKNTGSVWSWFSVSFVEETQDWPNDSNTYIHATPAFISDRRLWFLTAANGDFSDEAATCDVVRTGRRRGTIDRLVLGVIGRRHTAAGLESGLRGVHCSSLMRHLLWCCVYSNAVSK